MRICPDCLSSYKHSFDGKKARKLGTQWGKSKWPSFIYHDQGTRKCRKHHAQSIADVAARKAGLNKATPKWVDRNEIRNIYLSCFRKSEETKVLHEVDHIVPLKGKLVSGLHVPWNLRIITAFENRAKSNKHII